MSDPTENPESIGSIKTGTGLSSSVAAGIACLFSLVGGIVFLLLEKKDRFVRLWAMQALLLGAIAFVIAILFPAGHFILAHLPLIGGLMAFLLWVVYVIFQIGWAIVYIITVIKAFSGKSWEVPGLGRLARIQLEKLDARQLPPEA